MKVLRDLPRTICVPMKSNLGLDRNDGKRLKVKKRILFALVLAANITYSIKWCKNPCSSAFYNHNQNHHNDQIYFEFFCIYFYNYHLSSKCKCGLYKYTNWCISYNISIHCAIV